MLQTYVPLYRKYRPQSFKDLVGQEAISRTLSNAINHNRVAHAYLFTGPRGTGKTSTARILAKSLNCENGPTTEPCGICSSCRDITTGNALDVIEIDAASNNKVEDARDLIDRVQFAPVAGRYKVYIIDEVHMLTSQAFNTLLKTLEEPPPNLVFILATTEAHKVLDTIISRCQRFDFRRISQDAMVKRLEEIAIKEMIDINQEALNLIARRSAGGLRDALGLLDQISVLSNAGQTIDAKDVLNLIGALPEDMLVSLSDAIAQKNGSQVLQIINDLMSMGNEPLQIIKELTIHFRNLLIASTVDKNLKDVIYASEEFFDDLKRIAKEFKTVEIAQIIDKLSYSERMVRNSTQPILWLEVGLVSICYRHEIFAVEELQKRVDDLECIVATGKVPPEMTFACQKDTVSKTTVMPARKAQPQEKTLPVPDKSLETATSPSKSRTETLKPSMNLSEPEVKQENTLPVTESITEKNENETELLSKPIEKEKAVKTDLKPLSDNEETKSYPVDATWQAIVNAIDSPSTKGILTSLAIPMAVTSEEIVLGFSQEWIISDMNKSNRKAILESAVKQAIGATPRLVYKLISDKEYKSSQKVAAKDISSSENTSTSTLKTSQKNNLSASVAVKEPEQKINQETVSEKEEKITPELSATSSMDMQQAIHKQVTQEYSEQARLVIDIFQGKILNND